MVGVTTGRGAAPFDTAVTRSLEQLDRLPLWAIALAPLVGLSIAAITLRWLGPNSTPETADEYLRAFHNPNHALLPLLYHLYLQPLFVQHNDRFQEPVYFFVRQVFKTECCKLSSK